MVEALRILGYHDIHHMSRCIANPPENEQWLKAANAKWHGTGKPFTREQWESLLGDCMVSHWRTHNPRRVARANLSQAVSDFPSSAFAEDLIEAYPEAKIILNTRDVDAWYRSATETIGVALNARILSFYVLARDPFFSRWYAMVRALWSGFFGIADSTLGIGCDMMNEDTLKLRFSEHYEMVRRIVPKERLYEKSIAEGWEGMCEFLGQPVPNVPYPKVNDRAEFERSMSVMVDAGMKRLALIAGKSLFVLLALVVFWVWLL